MRMSCNGCRVLRKGCTEKCEIRPCIEWINSPDSQANATLFLAKFYGRAGLLNLINAAPQNLRPAIFRSLLYEACGRIVNPTFGSVGLLWSGSWAQCQAAVDAVLQGSPIIGIDEAAPHQNPNPPLKAGDIRHVSRDSDSGANKVKTRNRFKRSMNRPKIQTGSLDEFASASNSNGMAQFCNIADPDVVCLSPTRDGSGGDQQAGDEDGLKLTLGLARPRI